MQLPTSMSTLLTPHVRRIAARIFLTIGAIGPGLALLISPSTWGASPLFQQLSNLPVPLQFFGASLVLAALLMMKDSLRDIGYVWAAMFYLVTIISAGFAIGTGHGNSALIFTLPVLLWVYLEAAISATRNQLKVTDDDQELLEEER